MASYKSNHPKVFYKQVFSKNSQNSDGITHVGSSIFFSFKMRIEQLFFPFNFVRFPKITFLQNTCEGLFLGLKFNLQNRFLCKYDLLT